MSKQLACYYSILRFCPYPETDEFVNVGVALSCPTVGFLDFKRTRRRLARVNDFFPELDPKVFSAALYCQEQAMAKHRRIDGALQLHAGFDSTRARDEFFALVRPRETILFFSEPRVILSHDPGETLKQLFEAYVERRFAKTPEYQDAQMVERLEHLLREHALLDRFARNEPVGDERFRVRFPLVRLAGDATRTPREAIKALYLDKEEPTEIFRHADSWVNAVRRLREFGTAPKDLLFVLHPPKPNRPRQKEAFDRVLDDLDQAKIDFTFDDQPGRVLELADRD